MSTDTPNTQRFGSLPRIQTLVPGDIVVPATTMAGGAVEGGATVPPNTDINFTLQMVLEQIPEQYHGKSAYQVAVDNGFEGDEAAWLLSLIGPRGLSAYEVALSEGFEGTPSQWLASLVGAKGDDGRTAYEVAVAEGFSGTNCRMARIDHRPHWRLGLSGRCEERFRRHRKRMAGVLEGRPRNH